MTKKIYDLQKTIAATVFSFFKLLVANSKAIAEDLPCKCTLV